MVIEADECERILSMENLFLVRGLAELKALVMRVPVAMSY